MRITLVRHGQTDWNRDRRMQGATDIPLNDTGREQARAAGRALLASGERIDAVLSSPLGRARETAELIAAELGMTAGETYPGVTERSFGEAEGATPEDVEANWPDRNYPGMETDEQSVRRGVAGIDEIAAAHPGQRVLVVSHGSLIRLAVSEIIGYPLRSLDNLHMIHLDRPDDEATAPWVVHGDAVVPA